MKNIEIPAFGLVAVAILLLVGMATIVYKVIQIERNYWQQKMME